MLLLQSFQKYISQHQLFNAKDKLLLAVSGGLDSVMLTELCRQAGFDCIIAHCNFNLRGEESDRDEKFVKLLAEKMRFPVVINHFDTTAYARKNKVSIQVAARELRYQWFNELLDDSSLQLSYLLTAHHADDNAETMLMNFFKGTGIAGLHGILPRQGKVVRPLLFVSKQTLAAFARECELQWVEDSSNESDKYSRNFLRQQVIPLVQSIYPELISNLNDNAKRFQEIEALYKQAVTSQKKWLLEIREKEVHISVLKLKKSSPLSTLVYEITRDYGFSPAQTTDIITLLESESGKYVQSPTHRIIRNRAWLIIALNDSEDQTLTVIDQPGKWNTPIGQLNLEVENSDINATSGNNDEALFDLNEIQFPLILRRWKQGDYFYPLGMAHKKKIARFLIDQKLSKTEKENVWVLEMNRKICWVVGRRIDDRFKVTQKTKAVLKVTLR